MQSVGNDVMGTGGGMVRSESYFFFPSPPFAAIAADMLRCRIHFGVTMKLLIRVVHTTKGFQMSKGKKERKKCQ